MRRRIGLASLCSPPPPPRTGDPPHGRTRSRSPEVVAVVGEGGFLHLVRRHANVRASLPARPGAWFQGTPAPRVLRPWRTAEPGTPRLRVVVDVAQPNPDDAPRLCVRAERAREFRLWDGVHE